MSTPIPASSGGPCLAALATVARLMPPLLRAAAASRPRPDAPVKRPRPWPCTVDHLGALLETINAGTAASQDTTTPMMPIDFPKTQP